MIIKGGEALAKCLKSFGVEHVFGLPGHGNIGLIDGLIKEDIQYIMCHHETIAGMAADAYYRATHKLGVVCLTCTPGAMNTQLAIATAAQDCSAVLYIVGDIPTKFAGKACYEEFDINVPDGQFQALTPMFKRAWKVTRLELLPEYVANALNTALSGRPGPVLLDIPFDLHTEEVEIPEAALDMKGRVPVSKPQGDDSLIKRAADLLVHAEAPVMFIGGGVKLAEAEGEVEMLSELLNIPIVTSIAGTGAISEKHPNAAGFIGSYGRTYANELTRNADVILAVGTRFEEEETAMWSGETFRIPPTKLIQIDISPSELGKNYPVELGITGDARSTIARLVATLKTEYQEETKGRRVSTSERIEKLEEERKTWMERLTPQIESDEVPINPKRLLKELEDRFPDNGILVVDPSWSRIGLLQQFQIPGPNRCYIVGGILPIGWSTAAAIGTAIGRPDMRVVVITGDGGFLLNLQAVATAVEYNLPITWIVLNNYGYNAIAVLQRAYFSGRSTGGDFIDMETKKPYTPDYKAIAEAFGAEGATVERPEDIGPALEKALTMKKPCVLDFRISKKASRLFRTGPVTWAHFWSKNRE